MLRHLSNLSTKNITAAHQSCQIWNELLDDDDSLGFQRTHPPTVVVLSLALYASCLVRTGQDAHAVTVYEKAIALDCHPPAQELRLSQAYALQRLLRYSDAERIFRSLESDVGWVGAATCALRRGDLSGAYRIVDKVPSSRPVAQGSPGTRPSPTLQGMVGTLQFLKYGMEDDSSWKTNLLGSVSRSREDDGWLYRWIWAVVMARRGGDDDDIVIDDNINHHLTTSDPLLSLLKLNLCAFDDPSLVLLDDKVHLHRILSKYRERTKAFWPLGTIVLKSSTSTTTKMEETFHQGDDADSLYFLKERSGYGSHGNTILSRAQVVEMVMEGQQEQEQKPVMGSTKDNHQERLLQTMVPSPLLLHGRKFSLRVYVVYFSTREVYLSSTGLVKLASLEIQQGKTTTSTTTLDPRVHVTNSGSGVDMEQYDLEYFRSYLESVDQSFDVFWENLEATVRVVIDCYDQERPKLDWDSNRESLGIPKILGFDFVVDQNVHPWLVEVNRFPGMEPRDDSDRSVKSAVIHDTWVCASERLGIDPFREWLHALQPTRGQNVSSSLVRVSSS